MAKVDVKVVLLGQAAVGKSSLVERFINAGFFDPYQKSTIGAAFAAKRIYLADGRGVTLGVWDTAGAERFEALSRVYYHSAKAALVCFDATAEYSWEKLHFWVQELQEHEPACKIYIVVTKCDLWTDGDAGTGVRAGRESLQGSLGSSDPAAFETDSLSLTERTAPVPGSSYTLTEAGQGAAAGDNNEGTQPRGGSFIETDGLRESGSGERQDDPRGKLGGPSSEGGSRNPQHPSRCVSAEVVAEYAESIGARVFETSSFTGWGVADLFRAVAEDLADEPSAAAHERPGPGGIIRLHEAQDAYDRGGGATVPTPRGHRSEWNGGREAAGGSRARGDLEAGVAGAKFKKNSSSSCCS